MTENVGIPTPWAEFEMEGENIFTEISRQSFCEGISTMNVADYGAVFDLVNDRLPAFINEFDTCEVRSLAEIVTYNEQNRDVCMPQGHEGQSDLTNLAGTLRDCAKQKALLVEMRRRGTLALDKVLEDHDVIASIADGPLPMYAAAAGMWHAPLYQVGRSTPLSPHQCMHCRQQAICIMQFASQSAYVPGYGHRIR